MAEEIGFENGRNSNFQGLVTLTLHPAIRHTVVHRAWVKCELRVAKLRVGILRVEVRAKRASPQNYSSNQLLVQPISRLIMGSGADPGSRSGFIKEPNFD